MEKTKSFRVFYLGSLFLLLLHTPEVIGNSLDKQVLLTCRDNENVKQQLNEGYRAFIISKKSSLVNLLDHLTKFANSKEDEIFVIIINSSGIEIDDLINKHSARNLICTKDDAGLENLDKCRNEGRNVFIFNVQETFYSYSIEDNICDYSLPNLFPANIFDGFGEGIQNDLILFNLEENLSTVVDSLKTKPHLIPEVFNRYTGKIPNFLLCKNPDIYFSFLDHYRSKKYYSATVLYKNEPLQMVSWKEQPELTSNGRLHTEQLNLSPKKKGYRFSPDVFQFNHFTFNEVKVFIASEKPIDEDQILKLDFNKNISNINKSGISVSYSNVSFDKSKIRGNCSQYNGKDQYIDLGNNFELSNNITLSVWVKPSDIKKNRSIIGKGKAFSIKIQNGRLLFTTTGIKDHLLDSTVVEEDVWQHIAFVFSAGENVRFFKNGVLIGEQDATEIITTQHSLLIGTNLWGEYFVGKMDELILWNRALSDEEIQKVFQRKNTTPWLTWLYVVLSIIIIGAFLLLFRLKKKSSLPTLKSEIAFEEKQVEEVFPGIQVFGGFKLTNRQGIDLTPKFSIRRKQLFILILITSIREEGISSKQLTDYVWAGYSPESAKNNRSTQIQRIRKILSDNSGIKINNKNKKWIIETENDVFCDLREFYILQKSIEENGIAGENLKKLIKTIERGSILPNMGEGWLDKIKSQITDEVFDLLFPLLQNKDLLTDNKLIIKISSLLLNFDPLNETALKYKLIGLINENRKSVALECFDSFTKEYFDAYNQHFELNFSDFVPYNRKN